MNPLKLAILSLIRRKFPTIITVISIGMAVACSGVLLRLNNLSTSRFSLMGNGGDSVVGAKAGGIEILLSSLNSEGEFPDFLPYKLFETLRAEQNVKFEDGTENRPSTILSIIPFTYFAKFNDFRIAGTDESFFNRPYPKDSLKLNEGKLFEGPGEVVVGAFVANKFHLNLGDTLQGHSWMGKSGSDSLIPLKVVGILQPTKSMWDRMLFSSVAEAQKAYAHDSYAIKKLSIWGPQVLQYFLIYLKPNGFAPLRDLINKRTVGQAILVEQEKEKLKDLIGAGSTLGFFVTVLIILLASLSVSAMLVTRFESMNLQLAVLRALGYTKKEISSWLLWEAFWLGLLGCVVGIILDLSFFPIIRNLLGEALPNSDVMTSLILESYPIWLVAMLAIMLSVSVPLIRLYRQNIHDALRGT